MRSHSRSNYNWPLTEQVTSRDGAILMTQNQLFFRWKNSPSCLLKFMSWWQKVCISMSSSIFISDTSFKTIVLLSYFILSWLRKETTEIHSHYILLIIQYCFCKICSSENKIETQKSSHFLPNSAENNLYTFAKQFLFFSF